MSKASRVSPYQQKRVLLSTSVALTALILSACNNTKPIDIATVPTPEAASQHRVSLADVTNDDSEQVVGVQTLAHLPAETSDKTKFSSRAYGVKGSPRVTTTRGVRKGGGRYQIGKPYTIRGKKYYPKLDPNLRQTGLASWYGPNFHGRLTANGEVYDQYSLSAAHPTMPLPSYAKVTNLENGSSVTVRVNDRGPFSKNRVIDLSARAAQLLGYTKQGVAKVKVEYAGKAPLHGLDEKVLVASYKPGRVNQDLVPPLPDRGVTLAQVETKRVSPAQNQINSAANVGFAPPVPTSRINNTNVPRPTELINSYLGETSENHAFDLIIGNQKLDEPRTGMKNLVQIQFGPFESVHEVQNAEEILEDFGILQQITSSKNSKILLVILAEEEANEILETAKTAGIQRYTVQ